MKWTAKRPVTTENKIAVVSDDGREGLATVSWAGRDKGFGPRLVGPVLDYDVVDQDGYPTGPGKVLDSDPQF